MKKLLALNKGSKMRESMLASVIRSAVALSMSSVKKKFFLSLKYGEELRWSNDLALNIRAEIVFNPLEKSIQIHSPSIDGECIPVKLDIGINTRGLNPSSIKDALFAECINHVIKVIFPKAEINLTKDNLTDFLIQQIEHTSPAKMREDLYIRLRWISSNCTFF